MMNKKRTRTTGHIKYALFAPLTAALLLVSNIETVARTAERLIYSTEESTPRPERRSGIFCQHNSTRSGDFHYYRNQ